MDNMINRTIRSVYHILKIKGVGSLLAEFEAYDRFLESMGVSSFIDDVERISAIKYTRLSEPYRPVILLSKTILSNNRAESSSDGGENNNVSYFIDVAELWEMYLLKLLQNNLPPLYHVYSPNSNQGTPLLDGRIREIRPDILIERDGRVVMIIDAKYKKYTCFGETSDSGIRREDLYQMSTYLYHYGRQEKTIVGIFTSPVADTSDDIHTFSHSVNHRIGLVNLNINDAEGNIGQIHEFENRYIERIVALLDSVID